MYPTEAFRKKGDVSAEFIRRTPGRKFPTLSGKETAGKQIPVSNSIGTVDRLWRYPVKSMRGEELETAFVGFGGVHGDRLLAFRNSASPKIFPYLTARQLQTMLLYCPRFRDGEAMVDVQTPDGEMFSIDDPALIRKLGDGLTDAPTLTLLRSDRAMTDCRPISLFSLQTVRQIGDEIGVALDPVRFRANIYLDLADKAGFGEDELVGHSLRLGASAVISVLERDKRCKMISLDPHTAISNPAVLRSVAHNHDGKAGVYAAVLVEGTVCKGDTVDLLD